MNSRPETHVLLAARPAQKWPAQAAERRPLPLRGVAPGVINPSTSHRPRSAAWANALALAAIAIAITLLVVKNLDRNSSDRLQSGSAIFKVTAQSPANP